MVICIHYNIFFPVFLIQSIQLDLEGENKRENVFIAFSNPIYSIGVKGREQGIGKIKYVHWLMT
jgi:hypothetical protein